MLCPHSQTFPVINDFGMETCVVCQDCGKTVPRDKMLALMSGGEYTALRYLTNPPDAMMSLVAVRHERCGHEFTARVDIMFLAMAKCPRPDCL